jgi:hypothetical protein
MENKGLNNGSQENEWDEVIKNLNKKRAGKVVDNGKGPDKIKEDLSTNEKQVESNMHDEIKSILEVQKLERLAIKMEMESEARALAQKNREEQEAKRIKQERKDKAAQNAKLAKSKNAIKMLDGCGFENYKLDNVLDDLECMQVSSTRHYQFLVDKNGKVLLSGDWIHYGEKGFIYVHDTFRKICTLYHYDRETGVLESFAPFPSELELLKELEKIDPGKKFGFRNFYPDYHFKEPETPGSKKVKTDSQIAFEKSMRENPFSDQELEDLFK